MLRLLCCVALAVAPAHSQPAASGHHPLTAVPEVFVDLAYPLEALAARTSGMVIVRATTDASGRVVGAEPLSGPNLLVPAVIGNVKERTLSPGKRTEALVYRFEIAPGVCNDDSRSLFSLVYPNLAVITACSALGRPLVSQPHSEWVLASWGPPSYPPLARSARVTGIVVLELSIDARGVVVDSRPLSSSSPFFTDAAVAHSKTWRFRPSERRRGIIAYEFALDNHACESQEQTVFWAVAADYRRLSACGPLIDR